MKILATLRTKSRHTNNRTFSGSCNQRLKIQNWDLSKETYVQIGALKKILMKHYEDSGCAAVHTNSFKHSFKHLRPCLLLSLLQVKLHVEAVLLSLVTVNRKCRCTSSENDPGHLTYLSKFPTIVIGDFKIQMKISIKQSCFPNRGISFVWTQALPDDDIASISIKPLLLSERWNIQCRCLFHILITAVHQRTVISIFFQCGEYVWNFT